MNNVIAYLGSRRLRALSYLTHALERGGDPMRAVTAMGAAIRMSPIVYAVGTRPVVRSLRLG